jgi:hypothetical protein
MFLTIYAADLSFFGDVAMAQSARHLATSACRVVRSAPAAGKKVVLSGLTARHQHARARRLIAKQILRDLWTEAKRLHAAADTQPLP